MVKKILLVGPIPAHLGSKNYGGVAAHTWLNARLLTNRGYRVTVLATGSYFGKTFEDEGVEVVGLPGLSLFWLIKSAALALFNSFKLSDFRVSAISNRFFTKYKLKDLDLSEFNILHVQSIHNQFYSVAGECKGVPKVLTVHSYDDILKAGKRRSSLINVHRVAKRWFNVVVHVSKTDQEKASALGLMDNSRFIVHNPVVVSRELRKQHDYDVVFAGRLTSRKRPELVLKAFGHLEIGRSCVFLGSGPLETRLRAAYGKEVDFLGFVDHERALSLMGKSRVLCVPSLSESFGLVYVEAALKGTAVVGYMDTMKEISRSAGLTAEEQQFFVGFSPNESSSEELADILKRILDVDSQDFDRVMNSIGEKLQNTFSGDAYLEKMSYIYGSL